MNSLTYRADIVIYQPQTLRYERIVPSSVVSLRSQELREGRDSIVLALCIKQLLIEIASREVVEFNHSVAQFRDVDAQESVQRLRFQFDANRSGSPFGHALKRLCYGATNESCGVTFIANRTAGTRHSAGNRRAPIVMLKHDAGGARDKEFQSEIGRFFTIDRDSPKVLDVISESVRRWVDRILH